MPTLPRRRKGPRPHRRKPRELVVAPDRDERLIQLGQALVRSGFDAAIADVLAEGYVHKLRRCCWSSLTDIAGTGDDVERLVGWLGPPRSLSAALFRLGYLLEVSGVYVVADAAVEAPEYVKARWRRCGKVQYEQARSRKLGDRDVQDVTESERVARDPWDEGATGEPDAMPPETLFGPEPEKPGENHVSIPGFTIVKEHYHLAYQQRYGRKYPWRGVDFAMLKRILALAGDVHTAKSVLDAFLAEGGKFFAGHQLRECVDHFPRWLAQSSGPLRRAGTDPTLRSQSTTAAGGITIGPDDAVPERQAGSDRELGTTPSAPGGGT